MSQDPTNKLAILVVDPDPVGRSAARQVLTSNGFEVIESTSGREGLNYLLFSPEPALIFLELQMDGMSGWEFLAIIKSYVRLARIPVIALSNSEDRPEAVEHRTIARYLKKPVSAVALLNAARDFTARS
jgi:two-component system, sensor histidine kinase ChiS